MSVVPMLVPVLVFLKNVADILLFGHDAVLLSF